MAAALGLHVRTMQRWLNAGLPEPTDGEDLKEWATRAHAWRKASRKPRGRPVEKTPEEQDAETRFRLARAIKIEIEVEQLKRTLHSREECEAEQARRCHEVAISLIGVGQSVARRCYQRTPDVIQQIIDDEVRRRLQVLADGGIVVDETQPEGSEAGEVPA
jgi:phage terminase Nu1 subunit (DNA packaging protein)